MKRIILILSVFAILNSCCKNETIDSCSLKEFSADFNMYQEFEYKASSSFAGDNWDKDTIYRSRFFDGDSVPYYYYDYYVFVAKSKNAKSYQWTLGQDPKIYRDDSFKIGFSGNEGKLQVKLIIELNSTDPCNKLKKQFDTITKTFTIVDIKDMPYVGNKYKIKNSLTGYERNIEIFKDFYKCNKNGSEGFWGPAIINLVDSFNYTSSGFNRMHLCRHEIYFMNPGRCNIYFDPSEIDYNNWTTKGKINIISNKEISIESYQIIHKKESPTSLLRKGISPISFWSGIKI
jgi:hypothetical protein